MQIHLFEILSRFLKIMEQGTLGFVFSFGS